MGVRAVAVVALAAVLAGCSSDPEPPSTLPSLTSPPSAAPSPSPLPSAISAPTPEGAGAFARFWFEQLNKAARTGDTATLRSLSDDACTSCLAFADSIDQLYKPGGRIEGGVFTLRAAESPALEDQDEARVTVVYDVTATRQIGADGQLLREVPPLTGVAGEMGLRRSGGSWLAASLVVE